MAAIVFYAHCSRVTFHNDRSGYYPLLSQAFLAGSTYLNIQPSPGLLALANPYNPAARGAVQYLWDTSLYNGRYYLYFGPVPALFSVFSQWVTGSGLSDRQLTFFFCAAGTYYLILLLSIIAWLHAAHVKWGIVCSIIAISFGTWVPLMLHRPAIYEAAISGGYCFTALGLASLWYSLYPASKSAYWKLFGSLCLGLAVGSRIVYGLNAVILFGLWLNNIWTRREWRAYLREALYLATPWLLCIAGLAAYNYARFGSIFETGFRYQLTTTNHHDGHPHYWQWSSFFHGFYAYFLKPLPLAVLLPWSPSFGKIARWDHVYGLWSNSPFSLWSLWFLLRIRACKSWLGDAYGLVIGMLLYAAGMTILMLPFFPINRFMVDFCPWIMLVAALGYIDALNAGPPQWRHALLAAGGIMAASSAYTGIACVIRL